MDDLSDETLIKLIVLCNKGEITPSDSLTDKIYTFIFNKYPKHVLDRICSPDLVPGLWNEKWGDPDEFIIIFPLIKKKYLHYCVYNHPNLPWVCNQNEYNIEYIMSKASRDSLHKVTLLHSLYRDRDIRMLYMAKIYIELIDLREENNKMKQHIDASPDGPLFFEGLKRWNKNIEDRKD